MTCNKRCGVIRLSQHSAEGVVINLVSVPFVTSQRVFLRLFFPSCVRGRWELKNQGGTFVVILFTALALECTIDSSRCPCLSIDADHMNSGRLCAAVGHNDGLELQIRHCLLSLPCHQGSLIFPSGFFQWFSSVLHLMWLFSCDFFKIWMNPSCPPTRITHQYIYIIGSTWKRCCSVLWIHLITSSTYSINNRGRQKEMLLNNSQTGFWNRHSLSTRMCQSHIQKEVFSSVGCAAWECFQCLAKDVVAL